jgi:hypothetical protein
MNTKYLLQTGWILCLVLAACNPAPTVTPEATATGTVPPVTPMPSPTAIPVAYVGGSVPCYSGPEKSEIATTVEITDDIRILGKDATGEFWIVTKEETGVPCWLESRFVTAEGELASLPILVPTPTPIPPIPAPPKNFAGVMNCGDDYVELTWDDTEYESGYRIYEEGNLIIELPADATSYKTSLTTTKKQQDSVVFKIEAFNTQGTSERIEIIVSYYCK